MTRIVGCCLLLLMLSCNQNSNNRQKTKSGIVQTSKNNSTTDTGLAIDTNRLCILANEKIDFFSLKDSLPATLSGADIQLTETLFLNGIKNYNKDKDSNNLYGGYINAGNYKRQYVPYTNASGDKKVFINCFCSGLEELKYWRTQLVVVDDGGICFFNITINLTQQTCGPLLINGPG